MVSTEYSVIYIGDEEKDTMEIKMKYFAIFDFVQESGKDFKMLIESMHSKRAKHGEFMYIYFEHWKAPRVKKARDKLLLCLDTLKINYNPDTILALIHFANSVLQKPSKSATTTTAPPNTIPEESKYDEDRRDGICDDSHHSKPLIEPPSKKKKKPRVKDTALTLRLSFDFRQV